MYMPVKRKTKRARKGTIEEQELRDRIDYRRKQYRRMWLLDPHRADALDKAKKPYKGSDKRRKWQWMCFICQGGFKRDEVQVDHIIACGSYLKDADESRFRLRLLEGELSVLCKPCHKVKSKEDNRKTREERKKEDTIE